MLGALIIVFREVIEAGLIVGIALAVTRGVRGSRQWIAAGVFAGVVGALLVAGFAEQLSAAMAGRGQELFNASVLGLAVAMLAWHNVWMARHGRELARELSDVGRAVASGDKTFLALAVVVGVAVLREGSEVALFLYGILISGESGFDVLAGGFAGLGLGALVSFLTFYGLVIIPPRRLFATTSVLVTLLAGGLAAQSAAFLQQAGVVTALSSDALGHLGHSPRQWSVRTRAAHAHRLFRSTLRVAGRRLSRDDSDDRDRDETRGSGAAPRHGDERASGVRQTVATNSSAP